MSTQELETSSLVVYGELQRAKDITDKALVIEKEIGTEVIYTLISLGKPMGDIADSLGLSEDELELIMCRTSEHRNKYIKALMFKPAKDSMEMLGKLSKFTSLESDDARGSSHHTKVIEMFLNHTKDMKEGGSAITVNNTVVVSDSRNTPPLPPELQGVIEDASFKET